MQHIKLTREDRILNTVSVIFSAFVLILTLYPVYYMLIYSLNDPADASRGGLYLFPRQFTLNNYIYALSDPKLIQAFVVTVLRVLIGTFTGVFFTAMVSWALSRKRLVFQRLYILFILFTLYFGGGLIPTYLLYSKLGLLNSFFVYFVPGMFNPFFALLFLAFFRLFPEELEEAARCDGASDFTIFLRIVLPLSKPVLATVALFVAVDHWNDWFTPNYFVSNSDLWTLPTVIVRLLSFQETLDVIQRMPPSLRADPSTVLTSLKYTTLIIAVFPITVIYPFVQRYFIKGMLLGSVKS